MTETQSPERAEQKLLGRSFAMLRRTHGDQTQQDVADKLGISTQAYQKYESGDRRLPRDRIERVLEAIGASEEELEFERARLLGRNPGPAPGRGRDRGAGGGDLVLPVWGAARAGSRGVEIYDVGEPVRTWDIGAMVRGADSVEVVGESMIPWADPGTMVAFDRQRWPRPGKGCVVELATGEMLVKLYVRSDTSNLFLRELQPEERSFPIPLAEVKGVYGVTVRGD